MQVEGKAETQAFNIPETFLDLHPLAVDAHNLACGPVGFRQVAGEQPGLLFSASVLSTEFATRDAARHTSVFSTPGRLVNAVQSNAVRRTARHLDLPKRACCRSYLLVELLDRLPLTLLVAIKVTIAYAPHVIPTLVFDGLEPGATKPSIGHQDRYALL